MATQDKEDFAALLAEFEGKGRSAGRGRQVHPGDAVRGRIVSIGSDTAFVELGDGKSEAMIDMAELRDEDGNFTAKVGDTIDAHVVSVGGSAGCPVLRRTLGRGAGGRVELEQAYQLGMPVEGTVAAVNKGGLDVTVAGVRAFCPISQLELRHVQDATSYIGQKLSFRITKYEEDRRGANIVLSRRALLEYEQRGRAEATLGKLTVGAVMPGVVIGLKDWGAFVDIGGVEGMLHVSELGFARVERPSDVLSVGQQIDVQIIRVEKRNDPKRPMQISLSLKALQNDPWEGVGTRYAEGTRVRGKVRRIESFGAFVELEPGVDGLLPVSELSGSRTPRQARDLTSVGTELELVVRSVEPERRRISLGLGSSDDVVDAEGVAAARRASAPSGLGTLGDLLKHKKR